MMHQVCSEIQYETPEGVIHSDLCPGPVDKMDEETKKTLHNALDEWLEKSNGTGFFYIGDNHDMSILEF